MSLIATLEALVEAGGTPEMMLAIVRRYELEREVELKERREKEALRKREARAASAMSADNAGHPRKSAPSAVSSPRVCERSAQVVITSSSLRSEEIGGVGGECAEARSDDWPEGKPTDHMRLLIEAVSSPWLDSSKSHGLVTTSGRLAAWKRDGASWDHDVVPVVTALCAKQRGPVSTWKFFDQAIGRSVADNRAALEIPEAGTVRATGPPSFADRIAAEKAEARRMVLGNG